MKSICVIGSGISGSTVANLLSKKYKVDVYEKAKGIGGRSSHRRYLNKLGFDHGLQYISPKTSKFKKFCSGLQKKRVLKKWQGPHNFDHSKVLENKKHTKLIGAKGNNAISKYLLKNINCIFGYELFKIERIKKNWKLENFLSRKIIEIQKKVGSEKVICGLSGGVDSSVVAALLSKAIGKNLMCIFVNHGFLRKEEEKEVVHNFKKYMNSKLIYINASRIFYRKLKNIVDPEKKRKIIGREFIKIFEKEAIKIKNAKYEILYMSTLPKNKILSE